MLQLRNAAEKPYLWCAEDVLLKKSASAEDGGRSSIHSISILIIWVHIHLISIQYSFTTLVFFFVCFDVFGLVRRNGYQKKADMLPQEGLRELQSGECLELLEGPKEEMTHRCFHGWEKTGGNIYDYGGYPKYLSV